MSQHLPKSSSEAAFSLLAGSLATLLCIWVFAPFVFSPHAHLLSTGLDGLRSYFTTLYYVQHGQGWHFPGMNYPFGEHIFFVDNQPLVAICLRLLQRMGWEVVPHTPLLIHLGLFLSLILSAPLLYALLRHYLLPRQWALPVALIITFLSPQLTRFEGHFGLGWICFLPGLWVLMVRLPKHSVLYGCLLAGWIFTFGLIHGYYLLMGSMFAGGYLFLLVWKKKSSFLLFHALITALLPLLLTKVLLILTDPITDRPIHPYGFFAYRTHWEGLLLPHEGPLWEVLNQFVQVRKVKPEAHAYVGFVGFIAVVMLLFRWVRRRKLRPRRRIFFTSMPGDLGTIMHVALLILVFSMAMPFRLGMEFLLDLLPQLKQFRALGRFAWVFYYVFTVYLAILLHQWTRSLRIKGKVVQGIAIYIAALTLWGFDTYVHVDHRRTHFLQPSNYQVFQHHPIDYTRLLRDRGMEPEAFQALLPLPFFQIGSDKFSPLAVDYYAHRESLIAAFQTGLPLCNGILTRTSLAQTLQLVQLVGHPYLPKTILNKYPDSRPVLVLYISGTDLSPGQRHILNQAELMGQQDHIRLYAVPVEGLKGTVPDSLSTAQFKESLSCSDSTRRDWRFVHGDKQELAAPSPQPWTQAQGPIHLFDAPFTEGRVGSRYEISLWVEANLERDAFPYIHVEQISSGGEKLHDKKINPKFLFEVWKNWVRVADTMEILTPQPHLKIWTEGRHATVSNLMIRPLEVHLSADIPNSPHIVFDNFYFSDTLIRK